MAKIVPALLAVLLLVLYVYAVVMVGLDPTKVPAQSIQFVLSVVGGLVSALVVAVLAITPPSGNPARAFLGKGPIPPAATLVANAYLVAWLGCGIWLMYLWLTHSNASDVLISAAQSWFGLAVAAAYAFLGLKP
jgi:hypothetical protein